MNMSPFGPLLQETVQERSGFRAVRLKLQLRGALQSQDIVRQDFQGVLERREGFGVFALAGEGESL